LADSEIFYQNLRPEYFEPFRVSLDTVSGKSYVLQFKNSLGVSNWTALPAVTGDGTMKTLVDASATGTKWVYRVQVE